MVTDSWTNKLDLDTPAGVALRQLQSALPKDRQFTITLFGSAPIQVAVDRELLSQDIDLFSDHDELKDFVVKAGLDQD